MTIMSEEARTKRISDAVRAQPEDGERISLPWQDTPRILPVVKLELEALVLNPNSHRIRAQLESHPQRQLVKDSPYAEEAQEVIAELLSATEGFEDLKSNLREEGQRDAGVITHKGLLVNANSRLVAMRALGQNYIRVAVLPQDATEAEITALELRLQMQRELKQEYTFANELLFVEELISTYNRSPQEVALDLRWAASRAPKDLAKGRAQVEQASRLLSVIRDVQEISGNTIPLADFDQASVALKEIDQVYSRMLQHFFGAVAKPPERVTSPEVFAFAHGVGLSGREPSAVTIGARMACVSSFYRFLIRMGLVASNPCDQLERPRVSPSPPRGLTAEDIRRLLAAIPDTAVGLRDRAIILTLTLTGRRRAEVMNMKAGDISCDNGTAYYTYRGKGGKQGKRELPRPAYEAIERALAAWGKGAGHHAPGRVAMAFEARH